MRYKHSRIILNNIINLLIISSKIIHLEIRTHLINYQIKMLEIRHSKLVEVVNKF